MQNSELECSGTWTWQDGDELVIEDRTEGMMIAVNSPKSNVAFMAMDSEVVIQQMIGVLLGRHKPEMTLGEVARAYEPTCAWCDTDLPCMKCFSVVEFDDLHRCAKCGLLCCNDCWDNFMRLCDDCMELSADKNDRGCSD